MLTFFTTAKPFRGHSAIIQRNALQSWKLLHPDVEVILFGDEEGAAESCAEYGLRHEVHVERYQGRIPYVSFMFERAQEIARHDYLCYSNCDIILLDDFLKAFRRALKWRKRFLMVSKRWDTEITEAINFERRDWATRLRRFARRRGLQMDEYWIDFFLFPKGLYANMPRLLVGYCYWDNWMIWKTLSLGVPVLDCSPVLVPIHQNHAYSLESERTKFGSADVRSLRNRDAIGSEQHIASLKDSTHRMMRIGWVRPHSPKEEVYLSRIRFHVLRMRFQIWFFLLDVTRPLRSVLGLRSKAMGSSREKM
jgi:hypothetical protein